MITVLLLVPVSAVLAWLYRRSLPRGGPWIGFDSILLCAVTVLALGWVAWARSTTFDGAGPIFSDLVAAAGAYPIFVIGLAAGLTWRRARARRSGPDA